MSTAIKPVLYNVKDMVKMTGFSVTQLYRFMSEGTLPFVQIKSSRRFTDEDLQIFIRNYRNKPNHTAPTHTP